MKRLKLKIKKQLNSNSKWIVFWVKGGRIGSIELNQSNWIEVNNQFFYRVIQTDITGTIHLEVLGIKHTNKPNKARKANTNKPIERRNELCKMN